MLTNERLKEIIAYLEDIPKTMNTTLAKVDAEKLDMAQELLSARTRIAELEAEAREWREDAESLAFDVKNLLLSEHDGYADWVSANEAIRKHASLVEKYGKA